MPPAEYAASVATTRCRISDWWSNGRNIRLKPRVLACFPPHTYYETCPIAPDRQWAPVGRPTGRAGFRRRTAEAARTRTRGLSGNEVVFLPLSNGILPNLIPPARVRIIYELSLRE